jgi:hypothetical protein
MQEWQKKQGQIVTSKIKHEAGKCKAGTLCVSDGEAVPEAGDGEGV